MAQELDPRRVRVTISLNGQAKVYEGLWIKSTGTRFANALQGQAEVQIANLSKADRDYILTETSPFNKNKTPKLLILEAGRVSTGLSKIFEGNISTCTPSQPADIILKFKCQANQFLKGKIVASQQAATTPLSKIAKQVASDNGLSLNFQATDKNISNYSFTGGALKQVDKVGAAGNVNAFVDGNELIVKDVGKPLTGQTRVLNKDSGMIGIPEITEHGIKVTYLLDNTSKLGGSLQIQSELYPTVDGNYEIFKLNWDIASRDTPFYWIAEAKRIDAAGNVVIPSGIKTKKKKR